MASMSSTAPVLEHHEGPEPRGAVGGDGRLECAELHAIVAIHRDGAHAIVRDAGELGRLHDAVVRLRRDVQRAAADVVAEVDLARAGDGVEHRHRTAGGEQSARGRGELHPVAQPVEDVGFELHERRRRLPDPRVAVGRVGDEVGERGGKDAAAGDVREVPRPRRGERARDELVEQLVEQRVERRALLRHRLPQRAAERGDVGEIPATRLVAQRREVSHRARHHGLAHDLHLRRREVEVGEVRAVGGGHAT